ncbi:MAG: murein L,D-transpeptidase catalytic domain family protein [Bacteroidales bacterium]|nr:murein L,D-transpeptidase catalytic domain family protein [Bacteroidales bacterium]
MVKKSLLFLLLFFPATFLRPDAIADDHKVITYGLIDKLLLTQEGNDVALPAFDLLHLALSGYDLLKQDNFINRPEVITIIDFSLPSTSERLWVIDLDQAKVLFHSLVSHGRNSGELMAENFSNTPGSFTSSPGFYTTGETYFGQHGLSLKLNGLEKGINDKARERAIVIHGADYVTPDFISKHGRLGRSHGCPAVPTQLSKEIIETIKDGSCLFIYVPKDSYTSKSQIISKIASIKLDTQHL